MTYGHAWEQGQKHVDCEDFDTGERVSVEIPRGTERWRKHPEPYATG